ncbi:hypothetical protein KSP39_PZI022858 [Platanthera zijinensis]|uniref:Uncharacterized protein n=1 Tax=Platanthera zijinensis TaxID=2320716 RepID=A0AAP0AVQ1_9ASPA
MPPPFSRFPTHFPLLHPFWVSATLLARRSVADFTGTPVGRQYAKKARCSENLRIQPIPAAIGLLDPRFIIKEGFINTRQHPHPDQQFDIEAEPACAAAGRPNDPAKELRRTILMHTREEADRLIVGRRVNFGVSDAPLSGTQLSVNEPGPLADLIKSIDELIKSRARWRELKGNY